MPSARIDLEGQDALIARLNRLRGAVRSRMVLRVMEKAGSILLGPMKAAAPVGRTGNLRRSITMMVRSMNGAGVQSILVGPAWPLGAHGHLVEHGTKDRYSRGGAYRGRMPANPFIRRTYDAHKDEVRTALEEILMEIDREVAA